MRICLYTETALPKMGGQEFVVDALARREDDSRAAADLVIICAAVASLAGVGLGLVEGAHVEGGGEAALTGCVHVVEKKV